MRRSPILVVSSLALLIVGAAVAVATPPKGLTRTETSRATLTGGGPVDFQAGKQAVVLHLTLQPGGSSGWHSHPGEGMFMVDQGTLSNYGLDGDPCTPVKISAGNAYFVSTHPHHAHLVKNDGTEPLELTVMYFNVPPGEATRIDQPAPAECPGLS
jgi:quercetin dioxygenase-like cupin family protein